MKDQGFEPKRSFIPRLPSLIQLSGGCGKRQITKRVQVGPSAVWCQVSICCFPMRIFVEKPAHLARRIVRFGVAHSSRKPSRSRRGCATKPAANRNTSRSASDSAIHRFGGIRFVRPCFFLRSAGVATNMKLRRTGRRHLPARRRIPPACTVDC